MSIGEGEQDTETASMITGTATTTLVLPDLVPSCVDVAVITAVPAAVGVNTPVALKLPMLVGLTDQLTALLKFPVPVTEGAQLVVWLVKIEGGLQVTETDVIVIGTADITVALPDFVGSWVDVAVTVAVPAAFGVNTPVALTLPRVEGVTDQVTPLLKAPAPVTDCVQAEV